MDPGSRATLAAGAAALGVAVSVEAEAALGRYLDLLLFWNRRINLTAVRDPLAAVEKHFVDSLAVAPHLLASTHTLVDVGAGGGFPGAVLALIRPALAVTAVESSHKKAAFLRAVQREVPIPNLAIAGATIEQVRSAPAFVPFDAAVSRATWEVPQWLAIGRTLVISGGIVIAMEGAKQHPLPADCTRHEYQVAGARRAIVVCRT